MTMVPKWRDNTSDDMPPLPHEDHLQACGTNKLLTRS